MNLRELEYVIALDEEGHFNKAAERCFVSQPTLSGQLKKLENELGVLLVERTNRRVKMTEVGSVVAEQARRVLAETKLLKSIADSYQDPMNGEMNVGLIPTIAPYLLPNIIPLINKYCPKLKLWLHEHQTSILLNKLKNAELDLLILALPVEAIDFIEIDLYSEPFRLAVSRQNPLSKKDKISLSELNNRKLLLLQEGHCLRGQALDICFSAGASEHNGMQATSLETLRHMVAEDMGITLIPELAVPKQSRKNDSIKYISFSDPQPSRRIGLLYRKNHYREGVFLHLAKIIQQHLKI